jgi:hypothetical protein
MAVAVREDTMDMEAVEVDDQQSLFLEVIWSLRELEVVVRMIKGVVQVVAITVTMATVVTHSISHREQVVDPRPEE